MSSIQVSINCMLPFCSCINVTVIPMGDEAMPFQNCKLFRQFVPEFFIFMLMVRSNGDKILKMR